MDGGERDVPDDHDLPLEEIVVVDEAWVKGEHRGGWRRTIDARVRGREGDGPAEKPSTGRFVSSASWRRRMMVLEFVGVEVIVGDSGGEWRGCRWRTWWTSGKRCRAVASAIPILTCHSRIDRP